MNTSLTTPRPRSAPRTKLQIVPRITCRVCGQHSPADDARPLLCQFCAGDLEKSREHVATVLVSALRRVEETGEALEQAIPEVPALDGDDGPLEPSALCMRWWAFQDAIQRNDPLAYEAIRKARGGMVGPLADLIRLWCEYTDATAQLAERERWAARADLALVMSEELSQ